MLFQWCVEEEHPAPQPPCTSDPPEEQTANNHSCSPYTTLLYLILAAKQRLSSMHLNKYTAQAPHIDSKVILNAQQHFRWAIKPALYVLKHLHKRTIQSEVRVQLDALTLCPTWQELPKSTIRTALRFGLHNRMFSGLRSQWITLISGIERNNRAVQSCWANLRVRFSETPRKFVLRNNS